MATRKATTVKHDQYLLDVRRLAADSSKNHQTSDDLTIAAGSGGSSVPSNTLYKISSAKSESCINAQRKIIGRHLKQTGFYITAIIKHCNHW